MGMVESESGLVFTQLAERSFGVDRPSTVDEFRDGRGLENTEPYVGEVVISEIHYHPAFGPSFSSSSIVRVKRFNSTTKAWLGAGNCAAFGSELGVDHFEFSPGDSIPAGGYAILAPTSPEFFPQFYSIPDGVQVFGPYGGALDNGGERLRLVRPTAIENDVEFVTVDEVRYNDSAPWPEEPDGSGNTLERRSAAQLGSNISTGGARSMPAAAPARPTPSQSRTTFFRRPASSGSAMQATI